MPRTQHANSTNRAISNLGAVVTRAASADFSRSGPRAYRQKAGLQTNLDSWEALTALLPCIGALNLVVGRNLFGVPPSGGLPKAGAPNRRFMEPFRFFSACIGTMNLPGSSKAPQGRRTPKPGGSSGDLGQRGSVVECGGPPPLSLFH